MAMKSRLWIIPAPARGWRLVAEREGYAIELVKADMTQLSLWGWAFWLDYQPCIQLLHRELGHMWAGLTRVTQSGALMTGFTNQFMYMFAMKYASGTPLPHWCANFRCLIMAGWLEAQEVS
jgi:hypothetical protein